MRRIFWITMVLFISLGWANSSLADPDWDELEITRFLAQPRAAVGRDYFLINGYFAPDSDLLSEANTLEIELGTNGEEDPNDDFDDPYCYELIDTSQFTQRGKADKEIYSYRNKTGITGLKETVITSIILDLKRGVFTLNGRGDLWGLNAPVIMRITAIQNTDEIFYQGYQVLADGHFNYGKGLDLKFVRGYKNALKMNRVKRHHSDPNMVVFVGNLTLETDPSDRNAPPRDLSQTIITFEIEGASVSESIRGMYRAGTNNRYSYVRERWQTGHIHRASFNLDSTVFKITFDTEGHYNPGSGTLRIQMVEPPDEPENKFFDETCDIPTLTP